MDDYKLIEIDESFNSRMIPILESSPIQANGLSLYFDKSPDLFHISRLKYSYSEHLGFFLDTNIKGFASLGYFDAMVGGQKENVFSFYNFFLLPEARGRHLPELAMKEFFTHAREKANYGISVTLKGNRPAESYIGRQVNYGFPPSRVIDELVVKSILFSFPKKNKTIYSVRNATRDDIPAIVKLLNLEHRQRDFGLIFQEDDFQSVMIERDLVIENYYVATDRRGEIKGVCLAWDCSAFRRTRVMQYGPEFYPLLFAYKALEKFFPMAHFPRQGESFSELTITDYAVAERDPTIMHALLCEIYHRNHNRKYHFMNFASCGSDAVLSATHGFWHRDIISHIIFTSFDPKRYELPARLPYIDIAFL
jgi:hypothetical protein